MKGIVTYEELRRFWDLNDVMRWHELLDAQADQEWLDSNTPAGGR